MFFMRYNRFGQKDIKRRVWIDSLQRFDITPPDAIPRSGYFKTYRAIVLCSRNVPQSTVAMKLFWQLVCLFCLPALNYAQTALSFSADIEVLTIEKLFFARYSSHLPN
jgi:hypothetical protein